MNAHNAVLLNEYPTLWTRNHAVKYIRGDDGHA